ncbi:ABC transporter permease [Winogradskya humida]|uniref:ABC transporter permease n=1 Tax=Winogradskya humida TaxID=113566 RepID=UPI0031E06EEB
MVRRVRAYAGHIGLLAVLAFMAALLIGGLPRLANHYTDQGLHGDLARLPWQTADLMYAARPALVDTLEPRAGDGELARIGAGMPAPIPQLTEGRWFTADVDVPGVGLSGAAPYDGFCKPSLRVRYQSGAADAVRVIDGRLPASTTVTETMVSVESARLAGLRVGSTVLASGAGGAPATVRVVGVFEPRDPAAPFWAGHEPERLICPEPENDRMTWHATILTDVPGVTLAGRTTGLLAYQWRYRLATRDLSASGVDPLVTAVVNARRSPPRENVLLRTGVDAALGGFTERERAAGATGSVARTGLLATTLGLLVLAATVMAGRRREESALLGARGAAGWTIAVRVLAELALVVPAAVLAGWYASTWLPGRAGTDGPLLLAVLAVAFGVPAVCVAAQTGVPWAGAGAGSGAGARAGAGAGPGLGAGRAGAAGSGFAGFGISGSGAALPGAAWVAVRVFVVGLAALGVVLLRRRGLPQEGDPFLAVVPVLLGAAVALVVVQVLPGVLRVAGRLSGRTRGIVVFLGLARAGRAASLSVGPVAVLIVATATGVFTAAVNATIGDARDRATDQSVAADAEVTGFSFAPGTERRLTAVPGVDAAVPMLLYSGAPIIAASGRTLQAQQLVVDGAAADQVLRGGGHLPAALSAGPGADSIPAVVSPDVAAEVGPGGVIQVQARRYAFHVAAVVPSLPGLDVGTRRFVALSWQAVPAPDHSPLIPTRYLIRGTGFATEALRVAADAGQREYYLGVLQRQSDARITSISDTQLPRRATVTTWQQHRSALEDTSVNGVLTFVFVAGAAGSAVLALLAVGLQVLAGAPARGLALSRLRTLGLSGRQGRAVLCVDLLPSMAAAFVAGAAMGWLLPVLIGPALGLDAFTAGMPARASADLSLLAQTFGLLTAGMLVAVSVETLAHRRMRLGSLLRL